MNFFEFRIIAVPVYVCDGGLDKNFLLSHDGLFHQLASSICKPNKYVQTDSYQSSMSAHVTLVMLHLCFFKLKQRKNGFDASIIFCDLIGAARSAPVSKNLLRPSNIT